MGGSVLTQQEAPRQPQVFPKPPGRRRALQTRGNSGITEGEGEGEEGRQKEKGTLNPLFLQN